MRGRPTFTRRWFLLGGAATVAVAGSATLWQQGTFARWRAAWIERVIRSNLPGVKLDEPSLATFVHTMLDAQFLAPPTHKAAIMADRAFPWLTVRVPKLRGGLETLERKVLTEYLLGSDFFRVGDPKREPVTYYGPSLACSNPFARLG